MAAAGAAEEAGPPSDLTGVCFSDPLWLQAYPLNAATVLDYFAISPFYDTRSNNEVLKQRGGDFSQLQNMQGLEYIVDFVQEPVLYVIKKQQRVSPQKATPHAAFHVLEGNIYQAPHLHGVLAARMMRCLYHIDMAFQLAGSTLDQPDKVDTSSAAKPSTATAVESQQESINAADTMRVDRIIAGVLRKFPQTTMSAHTPGVAQTGS
eukprot:jgi/Chlat1/1812/Chrsp135S02130